MMFMGRIWPLIIVCILFAAFFVSCTAQQNLTGEVDPLPVESLARPTVTLAAKPAAAVQLATRVTEIQPAEPLMSEPLSGETAGSFTQANADVLFVIARQESEISWQFTVTVEHPDTGWEDYADGWDVVLPDGTVAKPDPDSPFTRLLLHPHENEQPFTRSQRGVIIEPEISKITVRAHDLVDGFGGRTVVVDLAQEEGPDYKVQRLMP